MIQIGNFRIYKNNIYNNLNNKFKEQLVKIYNKMNLDLM